jgi:outer membrane biosynthesis protein TonB
MSISKKKPVDRFFKVGVILLICTIAAMLLTLIPFPGNGGTVLGLAINSKKVTVNGVTADLGWGDGIWKFGTSVMLDLVGGKTFISNLEDNLNWLLGALTYAGLVLAILLLVLYIKEKEKKGAIAAVLGYIAFILAAVTYSLIAYGVQTQVLQRIDYQILAVIEAIAIAATLFLDFTALLPFVTSTMVQAAEARNMIPEEKKEEKAEEKPEEKPAEEAKPVEEKKEEKPAEQKPVVVVIKQEVAQPAPAAAPVEKKAPIIAAKGKARRRASFETKVKNADEDLRHKYYELRDYIKSYGIHNRVSIPGDTFSAHRQRYIFVTISGKHLKVSYDLNPNSYKDSTIPVEFNKAKKFADLALLFKVRSDLSLKRAEQLVDDIMASKGVKKPEPKKPADDKAAK